MDTALHTSELSSNGQDETRATKRPTFYDMKLIREEIEDFVKFNEETALEITGNKGYIRELLVDDQYVFNVWMSLRIIERHIPKMRYYYQVFRDKNFTKEEIDGVASDCDFLWYNNLSISNFLEGGNI